MNIKLIFCLFMPSVRNLTSASNLIKSDNCSVPLSFIGAFWACLLTSVFPCWEDLRDALAKSKSALVTWGSTAGSSACYMGTATTWIYLVCSVAKMCKAENLYVSVLGNVIQMNENSKRSDCCFSAVFGFFGGRFWFGLRADSLSTLHAQRSRFNCWQHPGRDRRNSSLKS